MAKAKSSQQAQDSLKLLRARLKKPPPPRVSDIGAEFINLAGGPKEFAKRMWTEFLDAKEGSITRQRIIDLVAKCVKGDENRFDTDALDDMDEDDLMKLCGALFQQAGVVNVNQPAARPAGHAAPVQQEAARGPDAGGTGGSEPEALGEEAEEGPGDGRPADSKEGDERPQREQHAPDESGAAVN